MICEDRELLAELAQLNTDVVPLAMRVMEGSATGHEQRAGHNGALCVDTDISTVP